MLDNSNVYWATFDAGLGFTGGAIRTIPKSGGQVTVLASGLGAISDVTVDSSSVYWSEYDIASGSGSIKSMSKTGGSATVLASGTPPGSVYDIFLPGTVVVDSTYVYWSESVGGGAIRRVPKTGGNQVVDFGRGQGLGGAFAIDAGSTYFYYFGAGQGTPGAVYVVGRLPFNGGAPQVLSPSFGYNIQPILALDSSYVYGVDRTDVSHAPPNGGTAFEVPIGGGSPIYLATKLGNPGSIAIDSNYVYYPGAPNTGVSRIAKTGGTPTGYANCVVVPGYSGTFVLQGAGSLAVDDTEIFVIGTPAPASGYNGKGTLAKFSK